MCMFREPRVMRAFKMVKINIYLHFIKLFYMLTNVLKSITIASHPFHPPPIK